MRGGKNVKPLSKPEKAACQESANALERIRGCERSMVSKEAEYAPVFVWFLAADSLFAMQMGTEKWGSRLRFGGFLKDERRKS